MYNQRPSFRRKKYGFLFVLFIPALLLLLSLVVMFLWNATLPKLVNANPITYWQSAGLLLLCRILFGGFKFGNRNGGRGFGPSKEMRDKWVNMSAEDRDKFKSEWQKRCRPRKPE